MNRHVQEIGVRKWAGADLIELQSQPLTAIDRFFMEYGPCIIQGCEITDKGGICDITDGLVALSGKNHENQTIFMVVPFDGMQDVTMPLYLTLSYTVRTRLYVDGTVKPISYDYKATASTIKPVDVSYLEVTMENHTRFVDVLQDAKHRLITDAERANWNAKETPAGAQLKADKAYTDSKNYADNGDNATLTNAKAYADGKVSKTSIGVVGGIAELNASGKVPSDQLPFGESSSSVYRADYSRTAYEHSQTKGNPHTTTFASLPDKPAALPANGGTSAACSGNAGTATKLQTARSINGVAFDGTNNITITAAANGGTSAACSGNAGTATKLQTARSINGVAFDGTNNITITAAANGGTAATCTGNAGTATKLQTTRSINGVAFDGTKNITITAAANGGNADTLDGLHAAGFGRAYSANYAFGNDAVDITTAGFIQLLTNLGAFNQPHWVARGSWSYAANRTISDTGIGRIHLSGATVEVIGSTTSFTIRVTTPQTSSSGGETSRVFIYINNGSGYNPGWFKLANTNDIPTSLPANGGNADTVDGKHASDFAISGHNHSGVYQPAGSYASTAVVTTAANGLMSYADKRKLNGIDAGANNYVHPNDSNSRHVTDAEKSTWNAKASTAVVTTSVNGLMSASDKTKLNGIASGANNYTHPSSHPASLITQSASYRFVSDTEKATWNAKAPNTLATNLNSGLMSTTQFVRLKNVNTIFYLGGTINGATGSIITNMVGTWSCKRTAKGIYVITHSIGHTRYLVFGTSYAHADSAIMLEPSSKTSTSFQINSVGGVWMDANFDLFVMGVSTV